jgi:2'-5' RNA ligase
MLAHPQRQPKERDNARVGPLIAVDVAVLLPPAVADVAVALSAGLPALESLGLRLDAAHLPHITLTQQFVTRTAVPEVAAAVERVVREQPALSLAVVGPGRGSQSIWMQIGLTPELARLHRALMDVLLPFEQRGGGPLDFAGGDARDGDVTWVSGFRRGSSFDSFTPHVTLGHTRGLPHVEPIGFIADKVALCHLGRFCTCREVLRSWTLRDSRAGRERQ